VRKSTEVLRTALESWADEAAAGDSAGRALVRRAIVALSGSIDRRRRLAHSPARTTVGLRLATYAPLLILAVVSLGLLTGWVVGAHHAAALGGYCPD